MAEIGQTLNAVRLRGRLSDADPACQWKRNGMPIGGAMATTYAAVAADLWTTDHRYRKRRPIQRGVSQATSASVSVVLNLLVVTTTAPSQTFTIQALTVSAPTTVDWGDGNTNTYTGSGTRNHVYASAAAYTVRIRQPLNVTALDLRDTKISNLTGASLSALTGLTYLYLNSLFLSGLTWTVGASAPMPTGLTYLYLRFSLRADMDSRRECANADWIDNSPTHLSLRADMDSRRECANADRIDNSLSQFSLRADMDSRRECANAYGLSRSLSHLSFRADMDSRRECANADRIDNSLSQFYLRADMDSRRECANADRIDLSPTPLSLRADREFGGSRHTRQYDHCFIATQPISTATASHPLPKATDVQLTSNAWSQAESTAVLLGNLSPTFAARTVIGGTLTMAGTNAAPDGTLAAECPPTHGKNAAYELVNDSCGVNPTHKWTSVTTS